MCIYPKRWESWKGTLLYQLEFPNRVNVNGFSRLNSPFKYIEKMCFFKFTLPNITFCLKIVNICGMNYSIKQVTTGRGNLFFYVAIYNIFQEIFVFVFLFLLVYVVIPCYQFAITSLISVYTLPFSCRKFPFTTTNKVVSMLVGSQDCI